MKKTEGSGPYPYSSHDFSHSYLWGGGKKGTRILCKREYHGHLYPVEEKIGGFVFLGGKVKKSMVYPQTTR